MRTSASAVSRRALDSQADVETQLYKRPAQAESGIQRIVPTPIVHSAPAPIVPSRVLEVKQQPRRRPAARSLGLNVFLMPRTAADPAPPWAPAVSPHSPPVPRKVVRKRSRWTYMFAFVAFVVAFVAIASPKTRIAVVDRSRPHVARGWTATKHAARATADFSVKEWRALRSGRP